MSAMETNSPVKKKKKKKSTRKSRKSFFTSAKIQGLDFTSENKFSKGKKENVKNF